ncbi:sugar phosphate isomerase/epimerase [Gimesia maris]|nr:sugar phosphate isomerase/epimerase [Gimesia maris]|tara:strand:+ start:330653 stop:331468 length:816 start_codon:yes stop_codon:yes gene_type:complete
MPANSIDLRKIMSRFKLAVATRHFGQPIKRAIKTAAQIGARGVQLDVQNEISPVSFGASGERQFRKLLEEFNLSVASLRLPARRTLVDPEFLDERVSQIRSALEFAWRMKAPCLIIHPGTIQSTDSSNFPMICEVLNDLARHASHIGTDLCLACEKNSSAVIRELISNVTTGFVGIDFDTAEMVYTRQDPEKTIRELYTWIKSYRLRDAVREMDGEGSEVALGKGMVVWDHFLPLVLETGYQGWLTVDRTQGESKLEDCRSGISYLNSLLP